MPELLEVEVYRGLAERVVGRVIDRVRAEDAWYLKGATTADELRARLPGERVLSAQRRGKLLLLATTGPTLGLRFGMTGRLLVDGTAGIDQLVYSSDLNRPDWNRFALEFRDGGSLVVRDPRRLGGVELDPDPGRLGPDAVGLEGAVLGELLAGSRTTLKARLLDQARIAGLGNLLVDEILWRAGLDPTRTAGGLEPDELGRLGATMRSTLDELGRRGGSHTGDLQDERHPDGHCPRDGAELDRRTVGGRTTYSCPEHQR